MKNIVTGIDVGTHAVRVVVAQHNEQSPYPAVIGVGAAPTNGMRHGYVVDGNAVSQSIRRAITRAEQSAKIKIKSAYVALGGVSLSSETVSTSVVISKADGEVTQLDIDQLTEQAQDVLLKETKNKKIIHAIPLFYTLDGEEILGRPLGMQGVKLGVQMVFVTALEHHFDDMVHAVNDAGITVTDIVAAPLALSMPLLSQRQKVVGSLLIDIGAETVSTAIFENDNLISLKVFEIGSSNITNDIALGLQVQLDEAEKIKREGSREYTQKKIDTIIEARLSDIYELVEQHLKKVKRAGLLPAGAIVSGGGAALPIIETFTKMSLHLPATVVDQQSVQQLTQKKLSDPAWLLAHGLCFLESSGSSIQVNRSSFKLFKRIRQGLRRFGEQFMP